MIGIGKVARKNWTHRIPAVILASLLLNVFFTTTGMHHQDLYAIPVVVLLGSIVTLVLAYEEKIPRKTPPRRKALNN